jgi:hypothetical protein
MNEAFETLKIGVSIVHNLSLKTKADLTFFETMKVDSSIENTQLWKWRGRVILNNLLAYYFMK